jgi:hypothetical protein
MQIILKCDSSSAFNFIQNDLLVGRAKHIDIRYHFIKEEVKKNLIQVKYCKTEDMVADILTKRVNAEDIQVQMHKIVWSPETRGV